MSSIIHACGLVGICGESLSGLLGFLGNLLRACGGSLAGLWRALAGFRCPFKEGPEYRKIPPPNPAGTLGLGGVGTKHGRVRAKNGAYRGQKHTDLDDFWWK